MTQLMNKAILPLFLLGLFLFTSPTATQSQHFCNTKAKPKPHTQLTHLQPFPTAKTATPTTVPIALHLFTDSAGTGNGLTTALFDVTLDSANAYFNQVNLEAKLCHLNVVMDNQFVNPTLGEFIVLRDSFNVPGMLNVFVPNSVQGTTWGGVSSVIGGPYNDSTDHVLVMGQEYYHGVTIHEIGHYLGLYHTHESMFGWEMVNGNNCQTAGDLICDTPADPGMGFTDVDSINCTWTNTANLVDQNGDLYAPSAVNLMSYSHLGCLREFTPMQLQVIRTTFDTYISSFDTLCGAPLGIEPPLSGATFSMSPNPSSGRVRIAFEGQGSFPGELVQIRITGMDGKIQLFEANPSVDHAIELSLEGLPAGMYVVDVPQFPDCSPKRLVHQSW